MIEDTRTKQTGRSEVRGLLLAGTATTRRQQRRKNEGTNPAASGGVPTHMDQEKRRHRQLKRSLKRAGNKSRRQHLKRQLTEQPDEAADAEFDYGRHSSADLNGIDHDATRRRDQEGERGA